MCECGDPDAHEQFLRHLAFGHILRDIDDGRASLEQDVGCGSGQGYYATRLGMLTDNDWSTIYSMIESTREPDKEYTNMRALFNEVIDGLQEVPPYGRMREIVGAHEAERCIAMMEELENKTDLTQRCEFQQNSFRRWSRHQVVRICDLINILSLGDQGTVAEAYQQYATGVKDDRRRKREHLKQRNEGIRSRAVHLQLWFPRTEQLQLWRENERTSQLFDRFMDTLQRTKDCMRRMDRGIMQYVPKRRITTRTIIDLEHNIRRMEEYCSTLLNRSPPASID